MSDEQLPAGPARVVSVGRNAVWLVFDDEHEARVASLRKAVGIPMLVPGDRIIARRLSDGTAFVERLEPRAFALRRRTGGGRTKTMAANVDAIAIVAAFSRPPLYLPMVDELIAFAELHALQALVLLTKPDLAPPAESEALCHLYRSLGYPAVVVNPKRAEGIDDVRATLRGRRTLLVGQSGVGKSSLFAALGGSASAGALSKIGRGRQTTTAARLYRLADGFLIDSPGVAEFTLSRTTADELAHAFVEFRPHLGRCRFNDCRHRSEPGCAVREAVERGAIGGSRYTSYRRIVDRMTRA